MTDQKIHSVKESLTVQINEKYSDIDNSTSVTACDTNCESILSTKKLLGWIDYPSNINDTPELKMSYDERMDHTKQKEPPPGINVYIDLTGKLQFLNKYRGSNLRPSKKKLKQKRNHR